MIICNCCKKEIYYNQYRSRSIELVNDSYIDVRFHKWCHYITFKDFTPSDVDIKFWLERGHMTRAEIASIELGRL